MKTGSVKTVAAFGKLVGICNDLGANYKPSKASIQLTALTTLLDQAQQSVTAVNVARTALVLAVNARREAFAGIDKLAARVTRAVAASENSPENVSDVKILKRKLAPKRKTAAAGILNVDKQGSTTEIISRSSSRLDFDGKADTFARIVQIVQRMPSYNPNEADLKVTTLTAVLTDLQAKSLAIAKAENALANARIARNKVLFGKGGVHENGLAVKEYIRSIFGVRSEPARELGKIGLAA